MSSIVVAGDTSGSVTLQAPAVAGSSVLTLPAVSGTVLSTGNIGVIDSGMLSSTAQYTGFKNRIINGGMAVSQRGTSGTVGGTYMVDRWYAYQSGTAPTWTQLYGTLFAANRYGLQLNGVAGNTALQINQRIESVNSTDLVGGVITVSGWFYQTTGSTMTLPITIYYATVGVDNWTSAIAVAQSVNLSLPSGTWTYLSTQLTLPSTATQGIQLAISPSALGTSQIFVMSNVQLEKGSTATSFDQRAYSQELAMCQRYYENSNGAGGLQSNTVDGLAVPATNAFGAYSFKVAKRAVPTMVFGLTGGTGATFAVGQSYFYQATSNSVPSTFSFTASAEL